MLSTACSPLLEMAEKAHYSCAALPVYKARKQRLQMRAIEMGPAFYIMHSALQRSPCCKAAKA